MLVVGPHLLQVLPHPLLQPLVFEPALLFFLHLLALFLLDLLQELGLHALALLFFFALNHIFFVPPADQNAPLLLQLKV